MGHGPGGAVVGSPVVASLSVLVAPAVVGSSLVGSADEVVVSGAVALVGCGASVAWPVLSPQAARARAKGTHERERTMSAW
jgi:hypothetical protein